MRSPKKRSLLSVNEHFEGEHNDKIHFLFSLLQKKDNQAKTIIKYGKN